MKSKKLSKNSIHFYLIWLLLILVGLILVNLDYNSLEYSIIGIGVLLLILWLNKTFKFYLYIIYYHSQLKLGDNIV